MKYLANETPISDSLSAAIVDAPDAVYKAAAITVSYARGSRSVWFECAAGSTACGIEFMDDGGHALRDKAGFYVVNPALLGSLLPVAKEVLAASI